MSGVPGVPMDIEALILDMAATLDRHLTERDEDQGCALLCGYTGDHRAHHLAEAVMEDLAAARPLLNVAIAAPQGLPEEGLTKVGAYSRSVYGATLADAAEAALINVSDNGNAMPITDDLRYIVITTARAALTAALPALHFAPPTYTVAQIRSAFAAHASNDDWGVPSFYEDGLIAALRGEYDEATS